MAAGNSLRRRLLRALIALAGCTLFLAWFASVLDHHFVERQPDHGHIFPGGVSFQHGHPYQVTHNHGELEGDQVGLEGLPGPTGPIIFLPPEGPASQEPGGPTVTQAFLIPTMAILVALTLVLILPIGLSTTARFTPLLDPPPPRPVF